VVALALAAVLTFSGPEWDAWWDRMLRVVCDLSPAHDYDPQEKTCDYRVDEFKGT
jgi:hypothetical protein